MKIVVFAGGVGTRLWPLSRKNTPKQFGQIIGDKSTLQQTIDRLIPEFKPEDIYIATGQQYQQTVMAQLPEIPEENFIFEPSMRDVGPAIGLNAFILEKLHPDEPMAILWSDHLVKNLVMFRNILRMAEESITKYKANFVFIAQEPRFANQNLGWIELGEKVKEENGAEVYTFTKLRYRPALKEAEQFFNQDNFVWNLGYFVTTPRFLVSLFENYAPEMYEKLRQIQESFQTDEFETKLAEIYPTLEKISFDDAILVKMSPQNVFVIAADLGWSDIGAWDALKEALAETTDENITKGKVLLEDTKDALFFNYTDQLCVGIDLEEMLVINTDDVLLVCPKSSVPKIKKLVENLKGTSHEHLA
ncbi:MAG TPA: sugar phosphate nucleotidyltransferase [Patescibacteria group bacterium]|nr:sugar phosphate nucleotidyltransferase [Patescibacteria group bacterium]